MFCNIPTLKDSPISSTKILVMQISPSAASCARTSHGTKWLTCSFTRLHFYLQFYTFCRKFSGRKKRKVSEVSWKLFIVWLEGIIRWLWDFKWGKLWPWGWRHVWKRWFLNENTWKEIKSHQFVVVLRQGIQRKKIIYFSNIIIVLLAPYFLPY